MFMCIREKKKQKLIKLKKKHKPVLAQWEVLYAPLSIELVEK